MDVNTDLMQTLVNARQEQLRAEARQLTPTEAGAIRKAIGTTLIRLGERMAGTPRIPARPPVAKRLALPWA